MSYLSNLLSHIVCFPTRKTLLMYNATMFPVFLRIVNCFTLVDKSKHVQSATRAKNKRASVEGEPNGNTEERNEADEQLERIIVCLVDGKTS